MKKKTKEEFISDCIKVHGNKYDYSLVEYTNRRTKVKIICKDHGIFEQVPNNHQNGQNCPLCINNNLKSTKEEFIRKSKEKYGDLLDYSLVDYISRRKQVIFICKKHGEFKQTPSNHLTPNMKTPCKKCDSEKRLVDVGEVISNLNEIHNHYYDYSLLKYNGRMNKSTIICPLHGEFEQQIHSHMLGSGCKKCSASNGEKLIHHILKENGISFFTEHKFDKCSAKSYLRFDLFIPSKNICIEYNGLQHYKEVPFFGGKEYFESIKKRDKIKVEYCIKNNIQLLIFKYSDGKDFIREEILKSLR